MWQVEVMNGILLKRLFTAIGGRKADEVDALCRRIVSEERRKGHTQIARELERIIERDRQTPPLRPAQEFAPMPTSRRDSAPLVRHIPHAELRHHMVLAPSIEARFARIEREHAARTRLALHGLRPRSRILFYGPPGCGKSLGAERLAWSTGLDLKKVRFEALISSYFGETAANLARIFEDAAKQPCALFLDECDTIARARHKSTNDVGEISRVVNALLEHLEQFHGDGLVIAATNIDDALDPAIFRRFDEVLKIPQPQVAEIERLLREALGAVRVDAGMPWRELARTMDGMSCAEVVNMAANAAKLAVLEGRAEVLESDIEAVRKEHLDHPVA